MEMTWPEHCVKQEKGGVVLCLTSLFSPEINEDLSLLIKTNKQTNKQKQQTKKQNKNKNHNAPLSYSENLEGSCSPGKGAES